MFFVYFGQQSFVGCVFCKCFLPVWACLLILLTLPFAEQKFLILMKSILSIISFVDHVFGGVSKKASPYQRSPRFSPMLSSRNFTVSHFTFRSLIHFELVSLKGVRIVSRFIFLHVYILLF